tara:strand:+ start:334 stop:654 length:321 start_codon:yes stop_codon:yes gene_type:complete
MRSKDLKKYMKEQFERNHAQMRLFEPPEQRIPSSVQYLNISVEEMLTKDSCRDTAGIPSHLFHADPPWSYQKMPRSDQGANSRRQAGRGFNRAVSGEEPLWGGVSI